METAKSNKDQAFDDFQESYRAYFDKMNRIISKNKKINHNLLTSLTFNSVEQSLVSTLWITPEGRVINTNKAGCDEFGYAREDFVGLNFADIEENYSAKKRANQWKELVLKTRRVSVSSYRRKDGSVFFGEITSHYVTQDGSECELAFISDISQRRRHIEDLERIEKRYRSLIENLNGGVWIVDKKGITTFVNDKMAQMLQYSDDEMIGHDLLFFSDEGSIPDIEKLLRERDGNTCGQHEIEFVKKDGTKMYATFEGSIVVSNDGEYGGIVAGVTDITARKSMEAKTELTRKKLEENSIALDQKNVDLKEIMDDIEAEKKRIRDNVISNVESVILPLLKKVQLKGGSRKYVSAIEDQLKNITSSYGHRISRKLSPREIEICNFIKQGLVTKEIANVLNLSGRTIDFHRDNIRKKLNIPDRTKGIIEHIGD